MRKQLLAALSALCVLSVLLTGCGDEDRVKYSGPDYILFADSLSTVPVQDNDEYEDIPVVATQACDYDRTLAVEVLAKESNAIEGKHYELLSNTVTIKAGERVANVKVRGIYKNIEVTDSLGFVLKLVTDDKTNWDIYGTTNKVQLLKVCPFDIHNFTGYAVLTSTYINSYMTTITNRLVKTEIDPDDADGKTIILKAPFYRGYNLKMRFTTDDILNPLIEADDQPFASTEEAFGTIYGDGEINMYQPTLYTSYYSSCEKFVYQYMTLYVPGMAQGTNVVGTFINVFEWVSDDEAARLLREGISYN